MNYQIFCTSLLALLPSYTVAVPKTQKLQPITVTSTTFTTSKPMLPAICGAQGKGNNQSPQISWTSVPTAQSYALVCHDQDAHYVHWVVYNIPTSITSFTAHQATTATLSNGAMQGLNSKQTVGWTGPRPPKNDKAHHYFFTVYALNASKLTLSSPTGAELEQAMQGHLIGRGHIMGTFQTT